MKLNSAYNKLDQIKNEFDSKFENLKNEIVLDWYRENNLDENKKDLFLQYIELNFQYETEKKLEIIKEIFENLQIHKDLLEELFEK